MNGKVRAQKIELRKAEGRTEGRETDRQTERRERKRKTESEDIMFLKEVLAW